MYLQSLQYENVRNLENDRLELGPRFNLFIGPNASGKTSILESINVLSLARSFRTHQITEVISHQHKSLTVVARFLHKDKRLDTAGIQKSKSRTLIRYNGITLRSSSEIASRLPLIVITPDSFTLLTGAPTERRLLLDWAMFHVEPTFLEVMKTYERCLRQRNSALRSRSSRQNIQLWDQALARSAEIIHHMRERHIEIYSEIMLELCRQVFAEPLSIQYQAGWDRGTDYIQQLNDRIERDMRLGYTNRGPHRADLKLLMNGLRVKTVLSRGQMKLLTSLMHIAQARLISCHSGVCPLILVDDLPAELDKKSRQLFLDLLDGLDTQILITSTESAFCQELNHLITTVFHVEHGRVSKVV